MTVLTYPVPFRINDGFAGFHGDTTITQWTMWWMKYALTHGINPNYSDHIFHPAGINLAYSEAGYLYSLVSVPLQLIWDLTTAYNIIWILTFYVSALSMYAFSYYLTRDRTVSFVIGLAFAFQPFRAHHSLYHLNLLNTQWIPLFVLYLIRTVRETRMTNPLIAGIILAFTALSTNQYVMFLFIFSVIWLSAEFLKKPGSILDRGLITRFAVLLFTSLIITVPIRYPTIEAYYQTPLETGMSENMMFSMDLNHYKRPLKIHPLFGTESQIMPDFFRGTWLMDPIGSGSSRGYLGYALMLAAALGVLTRFRDSAIWLALAVIFLVLSLGPVLHVGGETRVFGRDEIILPYAFLYEHIPLVSAFRTPDRFVLMLFFSLSVAGCYGMAEVRKTFDRGRIWRIRLGTVAVMILAAIMMLEYTVVPFPMQNRIEHHQIYYQMRDEVGDYAILDIPLGIGGEYLYHQPVHEKKLVFGYASHLTPADHNNLMAFLNTRELATLDGRIPNTGRPLIVETQSFLRMYGLRYVIIHKRYYQNITQLQNLRAYSDTVLGQPYLEDNDLIVYRLENNSISWNT
ncbi:MAG: hypothetical protein V1921_09235 [Candidatus Altiarchaeota archaeon]